MSNQPVAILFLPTGGIKPYKIRPFGQYFTINRDGIKGLFRLDPKQKRMWGKTACYFYDLKNMNPFDPVVFNELNKYLRKQKLTKVKKKDVRLSKIFRTKLKLKSNEQVIDELKESSLNMQNEMGMTIQEAESSLDEEIKAIEKKKGEPVQIKEKERSQYLVQYLERKGMLVPDEKDTFIFKIENEQLSFDELLHELRNNNLVEINEPMTIDIEAALEDFGAQDPINMSGHVDDLRDSKKGLKGLTSTPVKSFIPASVIFAIGIVIVMAIAIVPSQLDTISEVGGSFRLPFGLGVP